ncbi:MAG: hypothetical protein NC347_11095 [Clostridium sp.]|nr:hypothetical protein [Clostridium sp.]
MMNNLLEREIKFWENMYFDDSKKMVGVPVNNQVAEGVEEDIFKNHYNGKVDIEAVAWKLGRLTTDGVQYNNTNDGIVNGYGNHINLKELKDYIKWINANVNEIKDKLKEEKLVEAFKMLAEESPHNFGTVYIITMMFFISQGEIPIYDRFAHIAVKAIYADKFPYEIYVGGAPSKKAPEAAINILNEYRWLLQKTFKSSSISRELDRALWVYGHANQKCTVKWNRSCIEQEV